MAESAASSAAGIPELRSEKVEFSVGGGKASINAAQLVNTSDVPLVNGKDVLLDGKVTPCGYYSFSTLYDYSRCGRYFELKNVEKVRGRLQFRHSMWAGTSVHSAVEKAILCKMSGQPIVEEEIREVVRSKLMQEFTAFAEMYTAAQNAGEEPEPPVLKESKRETDVDTFIGLYQNVAMTYVAEHLPAVTPVAVEKMFIHNFEVDSGGTVPVLGFIDLIEDVDGKRVLTDHKTGARKTQDDTDSNMQLTLYSMVEGIPDVSINNFIVGSTGGSRPKKDEKARKAALAGQVLKFYSRRTIKDYEILHRHINMILRGIKAGAFPMTGAGNNRVCGPAQCPYYNKCFGRG